MKMHHYVAVLLTVGLSGCVITGGDHLHVMVPAVTGSQPSISVWKATHRSRSALTYIRDSAETSRCTMETVWDHFRQHARLSLELSPEMRDIDDDNERFVERMRKATNGAYNPPAVLAAEPFRIWHRELYTDLSDAPRDEEFDYWLLSQYLTLLSAYYGDNICVESPVPPRLFPGIVRAESTCILFVRRLGKETIAEAQKEFLQNFLKKAEGMESAAALDASTGPESFTESIADTLVVVDPSLPDDLNGLWRRFFAFFRGLGANLELVEVVPEHNIVLVAGSKRDIKRFEKALRGL